MYEDFDLANKDNSFWRPTIAIDFTIQKLYDAFKLGKDGIVERLNINWFTL